MQSETSYYPLTYTLVLQDCDDGTEVITKVFDAPNPHPECTVSCDFKSVTISANDDGKSVTLLGSMSEINLYTCTIAELSGSLVTGN